jgi:hypothetical protein
VTDAEAEPVFRVEWERALARLDLDLDAAEALLAAARTGREVDLAAALGSWAPPAGIGQLPESMLERAQIVLERQLRVLEDVANAAVHSRRQLEVGRRMSAHEPTRPLYVDAAF